jgi:cell wall-associated NlpC family hydrolase
MEDTSTGFEITRRTVMKAVGVAAVIANLGSVTVSASDRASDTRHPTAVNVALDWCETAYAPDPRVAYYDVEAHKRENGRGISLHGAVQSEYLREKAIDAARHPNTVADPNKHLSEQSSDTVPVTTDDLSVFNEIAQTRTVQIGVAPVRGSPNEDVPLVTETVYGARVAAFERKSGWTRVRTPDNYLGWVQTDYLTDPIEGTFDARLQEDVNPSINGLETVYAGTDCMIEGNDDWEPGDGKPPWAGSNEEDRTITVRFRTGASMKLPTGIVLKPDPVPTREEVVENAMYYLEVEEDVPYLWGGMTTEGIDCSGFVWMAYRMGGLTLPRDSDQQQKIGKQVSRDDLRPGDLLCFPGHIAISLGGARFVHSAGSADGPTTNSLDPDAEDYYEYLDESFEEARRII